MKIYVSPSVQDWNKGAGSFGTEEQRANDLADILVPLLRVNGFEVYRNKPSMTLEQVVADSNKVLGSDDVHLALHTNAGGGKGTEMFYYSGSKAGEKLAKCVYNRVSAVTPNADRGVKHNKTFLELRGTKGVAGLLESIFHDDAQEAKWFVDHLKDVAIAIAKGMCDYAGKEYKTSVTVEPNKSNGKIMYQVVRDRDWETILPLVHHRER